MKFISLSTTVVNEVSCEIFATKSNHHNCCVNQRNIRKTVFFSFLRAFLSGVVFCAAAFVLSTVSYLVKGTPINFNHSRFHRLSLFKVLAYTNTKLFQVLMPCYYGNEFTLASEKLPMSSLHSDWLTTSTSNKKVGKYS